jgi:Sulfotransferase domain
VAATPLDVVIAGVNKAGTTSLFVSLSEHPQVTSSAVKETRFFLPARYGEPIGRIETYRDLFEPTAGCRARLEATPSCFYGGERVARVIDETLEDPRIVVVLREPVARAISFFQYQKTRLRIAPELTIEEYLEHADRLTDEDFLDPANERYFAVGGSRYADFLPGWLEVFGRDRLLVLSFEELTRDPARVLRETTTWLGLDPALIPSGAFAAENRTMGFKSRRFQRFALAANDRFERILRRYPGAKRRMRALYFRVNGRSSGNRVGDDVRAELAQRFREPNERLADQLGSAGFALPSWLAGTPAIGRRAGIP